MVYRRVTALRAQRGERYVLLDNARTCYPKPGSPLCFCRPGREPCRHIRLKPHKPLLVACWPSSTILRWTYI
jgi:hypothetical protein